MQQDMTNYFFQVKLEFEHPKQQRTLTLPYLKNNVTFALKNLFGEVGASIPFEILKFSPQEVEFFLSCPLHSAVKVRSALTLQGTFQGESCAYHVIGDGTTLLELVW